MSALSDIIAEATEAHQDQGVVNRAGALNVAFEKVKDDPDLAEQCIRSDLSRRIKACAIRTARSIGEKDSRQASMFGLRPAYALDDEAHNVKEADELTRREFEAIINLRQRQVNADLAHLSKLRDAWRQTADIWEQNPGWLWRQVEQAFSRRQARAA